MASHKRNRSRVERINVASINSFTLIELITAMAVFSVIMLVLVRMLGAAQEAWLKSNDRNMLYENGQIAMELMARQIQNAQFGNGTYPFWHWRASSDEKSWPWGRDKLMGFHELLCFVTATSTINKAQDVTNLAEVKYSVFWDTESPRRTPARMNINVGSDCWLYVSTTYSTPTNVPLSSDPSVKTKIIDTRYNFQGNLRVGPVSDWSDASEFENVTQPRAAFTAESGASKHSSSMGWDRFVPYVTELEFTCYDEKGVEIPPDTTSVEVPLIDKNLTPDQVDNCVWETSPEDFPAMVKIKLSLLSKDNYNQWVNLAGDGVTPYSESEASPSHKFRMKHQRTFTRVVIIRSRQNVN